MTTCEATTRSGHPCRNTAQTGNKTCYVHQNVGSAVGDLFQTRVVKFAEDAAHTFAIVSQLKQQYCTADVRLPSRVARDIEDKEKRLVTLVREMETLVRRSAEENVQESAGKVVGTFNEQRTQLFELIVKHCKRVLHPLYVYDPLSLEAVADMLKREGPTEMRYVNVLGSFFTIFLEWSVYGVTKAPDVLRYLQEHWFKTLMVVTYFSWKYPKQVGKKIPVYKQIIEMYETMYLVYETTANMLSDLRRTVVAFLETAARRIREILNIPNPLRVFADRILAKRKRKRGSERQIEQAKIDMAVRLWDQQKALPMPDNFAMLLGNGSRPLGVGTKALSSPYYDTGATVTPPPEGGVFGVLSMIGMLLLFARRRLR